MNRPGATNKWIAIIRHDPCAYCGTFNPLGHVERLPARTQQRLRKRLKEGKLPKLMTVDHIRPRLRHIQPTRVLPETGFSVDHWSNLTPACVPCGTHKGATSLLAYLVSHPLA